MGTGAGSVPTASDANDSDTYDLRSLIGEMGYARYGDQEIRARICEMNYGKIESMYHVDRDWADPGCQHARPYGPKNQ